MITVYQLPGAFGLDSASPFCLKLTTWLRLAGLDYTARTANLRKSPTGKVPYVDLGGELVADSGAIIARLARERGVTLDRDLSPERLATAHLVRRTLEESLYFALVTYRWKTDATFAELRELFRQLVPAPLMLVVPRMARKGVLQAMHAQGMGRLPMDAVFAHGVEDLRAVSQVLGDRPFLLGDAPTSVDATGFAMIASLHFAPHDNPMKRFIAESNLAAYAERMKARAWPSP